MSGETDSLKGIRSEHPLVKIPILARCLKLMLINSQPIHDWNRRLIVLSKTKGNLISVLVLFTSILFPLLGVGDSSIPALLPIPRPMPH